MAVVLMLPIPYAIKPPTRTAMQLPKNQADWLGLIRMSENPQNDR